MAAALEPVEDLASFGEDADGDADQRAELVKRYTTVRPSLPMLTTVSAMTGAHDPARRRS